MVCNGARTEWKRCRLVYDGAGVVCNGKCMVWDSGGVVCNRTCMVWDC